jgi:hypothetical protein
VADSISSRCDCHVATVMPSAISMTIQALPSGVSPRDFTVPTHSVGNLALPHEADHTQLHIHPRILPAGFGVLAVWYCLARVQQYRDQVALTLRHGPRRRRIRAHPRQMPRDGQAPNANNTIGESQLILRMSRRIFG